ncbi:hypothetical protein ACA910_000914 [Epithemia clementina (nom. ined.)]
MESVLTDFVRFNKQSIRQSMKTQVQAYDEYDKGNDTACIQALMASLDVKLMEELMSEITLDDCFCEVWLELNQIVCNTSVERFAKLRTDIRDRLPSKLGPQNMVEMANAQLADARELYKAKQYNPNPTSLELIDSFLLADGSQTFTYKMNKFRSSLRVALESIQSMTDIDDKNNHMRQCGLHFEDICRRVKDLYREELDNNRWNPAKNYKGYRGPPRHYGAYTANPPDSFEPSALVLEQHMRPSSGPPTHRAGGCHYAGPPLTGEILVLTILPTELHHCALVPEPPTSPNAHLVANLLDHLLCGPQHPAVIIQPLVALGVVDEGVGPLDPQTTLGDPLLQPTVVPKRL